MDPMVVDRVDKPNVKRAPTLLTPACRSIESAPCAVDILLIVVIVVTERFDIARLYDVLSDDTAAWNTFEVFKNAAAFETSWFERCMPVSVDILLMVLKV